MSNPKSPEYVNFGLRTAQIAAELADAKRDYFAGEPGMTMRKRTELEAEMAHIKLRREELRVEHKDGLANAKRKQIEILTKRLEGMGLGHLIEEARVEALEQTETQS